VSVFLRVSGKNFSFDQEKMATLPDIFRVKKSILSTNALWMKLKEGYQM